MKNIGVIGGDLRIIRLIEILAKEDYKIYVYGLEKNFFIKDNIIKCTDLELIKNNCNIIISGVPFSRDGEYIYSPFSNKKISIDKTIEELKGKTIIAGNIKENDKVKIIDLMKIEELTILNIIPTVEGAIEVAMQETEFTIHNSNCLVLGYGRIGKLLTKTLKGLGANVSCMARKESDLTWIKTYGYNQVELSNLKNNLEKNRYDIIFNTIPKILLDEEKLENIKDKGTLVIELASNPGGIDSEIANKYNINVVNALGLPGKVAPKTAAIYIKKVIDKILE